MLDIFLVVFLFGLFIGMFGWGIALTFRLAWGVAKIVAIVLLALAVPVLVSCLVVGAGVAMLAPVCMVIGAVTLVKFFAR